MCNKCTLLVNSCDAYSDLWEPFFRILIANWDPIPYPIILNTESLAFSFPSLEIHTFGLYPKENNVPWGERLIATLQRIDTEFILFMLDDFFLLDRVDQERINQCISWMTENPEIAVFSFSRTHQPNIRDGKYPHFERRPQNGEYRLNTQAAVWRREKLISYIRPHESPWEWELYGSIRSRRYPEIFYSAIEGEPSIMLYDWSAGGAVHRGKWTASALKLLKEYDIQVDVTKRGVECLKNQHKLSLPERAVNKLKRVPRYLKSVL